MTAPFASLLLPVCLFAASPAGDGYLGVEVTDDGGPRVVRVIEGSPAARADLRVGDVFLAVDDEETPDVERFVAAVSRHDAGDEVRFVLLRGERKLEKKIRLGRRPGTPRETGKGKEKEKERARVAEPRREKGRGRPRSRPERRGGLVLRPPQGAAPKAKAEPTGPAFLGVAVEEAADDGVQVVDVLPGGPASRGLREGDVLLRIGDEEIEDLDDVEEALSELRPGQRVRIVLRRDGKERSVRLTLGARPREARAVAPRPERPRPEPRRLRPAPRETRPSPVPTPRRAERVRAPSGDLAEVRAELRRLREEIAELRALVRKLLRQDGGRR